MQLLIPSRMRAAGSGASWRRRALIAVMAFSAMNAIAGGIGLVVNGLGVPSEQLERTPFDSFTVPGLLLAIVVGGSMASATIAVVKRAPWAWIAAMLAGGVMLGWIAIESVMITDGRPLQVAVALLSLATIVLGAASRAQAAGG